MRERGGRAGGEGGRGVGDEGNALEKKSEGLVAPP